MFKISGFYDEASFVLDEQIALIKELGEEYLCPRKVDDKNIADYTFEEFKEKVYPKLEANGIKISSYGSPIGKIALTNQAVDKEYKKDLHTTAEQNADSEDGFDKQLKKLAEIVKMCKLTNTKFIRIFSFFVGKKMSHEEAFPLVVERLKRCLEVVEGEDIILIHENEKGIYGDTPERVLQLYHEINHPQFKLCYDASNYIQCGVDPWQAYLDTREFTVYYHMKDCWHGVEVPLGKGEGRIEEIVSDLKERYKDIKGPLFLTLEPHTAIYSVAKRLAYCLIIPLFTKYGKGFRKIDKAMGVKALQKVTRKQVMVWQHELLKKML